MENQLYFAEILPNIYWVYHYTAIKFHPTHRDFISKVCQTNNIKELIKIDSNCTFWRRYDNSNKTEEFTLLNQLISNINDKIAFNYNNRIPTLIISITNNDVALAAIINYYMSQTKLTAEIILDALKYKIPNLPDIGSKIGEYLNLA